MATDPVRGPDGQPFDADDLADDLADEEADEGAPTPDVPDDE